MDGIGLVLAGGGGKGAYQIGVWKYLRERGLDRFVRAVSGTSVGAINGALFVAGDYDRAQRLWSNIQPEQILSSDGLFLGDLVRWIIQSDLFGLFSSAAEAATVSAMASGIISMLDRSYAFSRDGLLELMEHELNFSAIRRSTIPCFATCLTVPELSLRRFRLGDYLPKDQRTILLASSAIPLIFDSVTFRGQQYCDGGVPLVGDNIPIRPIYDLGLEYIVVVHLSQQEPLVPLLYPGARFIEIIPQVDLGGPMDGTLDFTDEGAAWRIDQGYRDAAKVFDSIFKPADRRRKKRPAIPAEGQTEGVEEMLRGLALTP